MSYLAKQKLMYYKKYKIDIWGFIKNTLQIVLHDNTFYRVYEANKDLKKLRFLFKQTKWVYFKLKYEKEKALRLFQNEKINFALLKKTNKAYNRLRYKKIKIIWKMINLHILFTKFIPLTITKRLSKIFAYVITRERVKPKVYFRRPFIYESRIPTSGKKKRRINDQFVSFRLVKLFYVMYSYKQIKRIAWKAKHQRGVFEHNYFLVIESKLPSYLYRTSFFPTLFESLEFVKAGNVWVNKKFKPLIFYTVKLFDIVGFRVIYKAYIFWAFFKRLRRKAFLFLFSRCMYISFNFLFTILISRFTSHDIINSFSFDYYRIANHAQ